ncbi:MAG: rhomboid family intramembrane serine protease [Nanoarchaeota archaeon]|nr:rhomboid family intramembrane serine protease [Nanoarchaeota archaeon]
MVFGRNKHPHYSNNYGHNNYNSHSNRKYTNYHNNHHRNFSFFRNNPYTILLISTLIILYIAQLLGHIPFEKVVLDTQKIIEFNIISAFTSLFFHANFLHLLSNVIAILIFSRKVEHEIGVGTIFLFIIGGIIANIIASFYAAFIVGEHYLSIGASAGAAPLIFFTIIARPLSLLTPIAWFLILIDILNLTNQNTTTNHAVHVTGYIASLLLISIINFRNKRYVYYSIGFNLLGLIGLYFGLSYYGYLI